MGSALCGAYLAAVHSAVALQPEAESEAGQLPRLARHSTASSGWKRSGAGIEPLSGLQVTRRLAWAANPAVGSLLRPPAASILGAAMDSSDRGKALFTQAEDPAHLLDENVASHAG